MVQLALIVDQQAMILMNRVRLRYPLLLSPLRGDTKRDFAVFVQ